MKTKIITLLFALVSLTGCNNTQQYFHDHVEACIKVNQAFIRARESESYKKFKNGELMHYSDPALSSLEEMATHNLYDCSSITPQESCESIDRRFPLINVIEKHDEQRHVIVSFSRHRPNRCYCYPFD